MRAAGLVVSRLCVLLTRHRQACIVVGRDSDRDLLEGVPPATPGYLGWDLVADPMCGIGTTVIEAIHLGRDSIGVEYESRWAGIAADGIALAGSQGATGHGEVICGDARQLPRLAPERARGHVALVVTSPPYGPGVHGDVRAVPGRVAKYDNTYGSDTANLARQDLAGLLDGFTGILAGCARLLRPGGIAVVTAGPGASTASWSTSPALWSKPAAPRAWFRWSGASPCWPGYAAGS